MPSQAITAIFTAYMPDGPGYAGPVEVILEGRQVQVKTVQEEVSYSGVLTAEMPAIAECRDPDGVHLRDIYETLPQDDRDYLKNDASNLDASRVKSICFVDGVEGAIILWGECCIVSVVRFGPGGRVIETLDLSSVDEDVRSVADDVLTRGDTYGFKQDRDGVREAVEESANLLRIELTEAQIVKACDLVLEEQDLETA